MTILTPGMSQLRIGLVTAYPPTQGRLSEYGWHLAHELSHNRRVHEIHVLADRVAGARSFRDGRLVVERCWTFDGFDFPWRIAEAVKRKRLDAIWFNIHLTSTGRRRARRACALSAPALLRLLGYRTLVTLHHLPDLTDLAAAGIETNRFDLVGARLVVRLLGCAGTLCLPLPEYAHLARQRYGAPRVRFIPLGASGLPPSGDVNRDPNALLAFGRFGSYKRLEVLLGAVTLLHDSGHPICLDVGGSDSVYSPGYLTSLRRQYEHCANIRFHGYVPEERVPSMFQGCAAAVLPYRTITGASSVAMQAAMYSTPILASDIPGLRLMSNLGLDMTFMAFEDPGSLAAHLAAFLASPRSHARQVERNLAYCSTVTMTDIVDTYLDEIESVDRDGYRGRMTVEMTSSVRS